MPDLSGRTSKKTFFVASLTDTSSYAASPSTPLVFCQAYYSPALEQDFFITRFRSKACASINFHFGQTTVSFWPIFVVEVIECLKKI